MELVGRHLEDTIAAGAMSAAELDDWQQTNLGLKPSRSQANTKCGLPSCTNLAGWQIVSWPNAQ